MAQQTQRDANNLHLQELFHRTQNDALRRNEEHAAQCFARYNEYLTLRQQLDVLPGNLTHEVMVPIGNRALMRGKLVHTNEILVHLGDGWFVKQSAKLAAEICDRRIESHGDMLKKLETERALLVNNRQLPIAEQAFGNEIVEQYDEQAEAEWRVRHRLKERDYRQKLAKERHAEKTEKSDTDDEELWEKLDRLELQEELEEELERMKGLHKKEEPLLPVSTEKENQDEIQNLPSVDAAVTQGESSTSIKAPTRRISFGEKHVVSFSSDDHKTAENEDSSDDEPFRIEFSHTKYQESSNRTSNETETITSPSDIYKLFPKPKLKSILKRNTNYKEIENSVVVCPPPSGLPPSFDSYDYIEEEVNEPLAFGDIVERQVETLAPANPVESVPVTKNRPVSRFKASRKKK